MNYAKWRDGRVTSYSEEITNTPLKDECFGVPMNINLRPAWLARIMPRRAIFTSSHWDG